MLSRRSTTGKRGRYRFSLAASIVLGLPAGVRRARLVLNHQGGKWYASSEAVPVSDDGTAAFSELSFTCHVADPSKHLHITLLGSRHRRGGLILLSGFDHIAQCRLPLFPLAVLAHPQNVPAARRFDMPWPAESGLRQECAMTVVRLSKEGVEAPGGGPSGVPSAAARMGELAGELREEEKEEKEDEEEGAAGAKGGPGRALAAAAGRVGDALGAGLTQASERAIQGRSTAPKEQEEYEEESGPLPIGLPISAGRAEGQTPEVSRTGLPPSTGPVAAPAAETLPRLPAAKEGGGPGVSASPLRPGAEALDNAGAGAGGAEGAPPQLGAATGAAPAAAAWPVQKSTSSEWVDLVRETLSRQQGASDRSSEAVAAGGGAGAMAAEESRDAVSTAEAARTAAEEEKSEDADTAGEAASPQRWQARRSEDAGAGLRDTTAAASGGGGAVPARPHSQLQQERQRLSASAPTSPAAERRRPLPPPPRSPFAIAAGAPAAAAATDADGARTLSATALAYNLALQRSNSRSPAVSPVVSPTASPTKPLAPPMPAGGQLEATAGATQPRGSSAAEGSSIPPEALAGESAAAALLTAVADEASSAVAEVGGEGPPAAAEGEEGSSAAVSPGRQQAVHEAGVEGGLEERRAGRMGFVDKGRVSFAEEPAAGGFRAATQVAAEGERDLSPTVSERRLPLTPHPTPIAGALSEHLPPRSLPSGVFMFDRGSTSVGSTSHGSSGEGAAAGGEGTNEEGATGGAAIDPQQSTEPATKNGEEEGAAAGSAEATAADVQKGPAAAAAAPINGGGGLAAVAGRRRLFPPPAPSEIEPLSDGEQPAREDRLALAAAAPAAPEAPATVHTAVSAPPAAATVTAQQGERPVDLLGAQSAPPSTKAREGLLEPSRPPSAASQVVGPAGRPHNPQPAAAKSGGTTASTAAAAARLATAAASATALVGGAAARAAAGWFAGASGIAFKTAADTARLMRSGSGGRAAQDRAAKAAAVPAAELPAVPVANEAHAAAQPAAEQQEAVLGGGEWLPAPSAAASSSGSTPGTPSCNTSTAGRPAKQAGDTRRAQRGILGFPVWPLGPGAWLFKGTTAGQQAQAAGEPRGAASPAPSDSTTTSTAEGRDSSEAEAETREAAAQGPGITHAGAPSPATAAAPQQRRVSVPSIVARAVGAALALPLWWLSVQVSVVQSGVRTAGFLISMLLWWVLLPGRLALFVIVSPLWLLWSVLWRLAYAVTPLRLHRRAALVTAV